MRSLVGTLVTNIVSEVTAAQAYRHLAKTSAEPVLARIATFISGDEARHAASFFLFARKALADLPADAARREKARGLEVLHAWLGGVAQSTHPVAEMLERLESSEASDVIPRTSSIRARVIRVVGLLLDVPLSGAEDVEPNLRALLARAP
jgi:hypothetical protein